MVFPSFFHGAEKTNQSTFKNLDSAAEDSVSEEDESGTILPKEKDSNDSSKLPMKLKPGQKKPSAEDRRSRYYKAASSATEKADTKDNIDIVLVNNNQDKEGDSTKKVGFIDDKEDKSLLSSQSKGSY